MGQRLQGSVLRGIGQVLAGLAAVQIPPEYGPALLAGLSPAGRPHPLGAEHISPRSLRTLSHRYLPPGSIRQFIAALHHGAPLPVHQLGLAGTPESLIVRIAPGRLQGPHGGACRNIQHVPHPQARQAVSKGRRHTEGVVPGNPSGFQMAAPQSLLQHLQSQLRLRPVLTPACRHSRRLTPAAVRSPDLRQVRRLSARARPKGLT